MASQFAGEKALNWGRQMRCNALAGYNVRNMLKPTQNRIYGQLQHQ